MSTTQEPKAPVEKPGSGGADAKTERGTATEGSGATVAGGAKGGVKPQDDDRPPQN
jgi:hypothetical protein